MPLSEQAARYCVSEAQARELLRAGTERNELVLTQRTYQLEALLLRRELRKERAANVLADSMLMQKDVQLDIRTRQWQHEAFRRRTAGRRLLRSRVLNGLLLGVTGYFLYDRLVR